jgi:hypothetical protein
MVQQTSHDDGCAGEIRRPGDDWRKLSAVL